MFNALLPRSSICEVGYGNLKLLSAKALKLDLRNASASRWFVHVPFCRTFGTAASIRAARAPRHGRPRSRQRRSGARTGDSASIEDPSWSKVFHRYKAERLQLRMELWHAYQMNNKPKIVALTAAWRESGPGGKAPLPLTPAVLAATTEQQQRLANGRWLVPGMCFVHKTLGFRGAIIGCDPWGSSRASRAQPQYHCVVDQRDMSDERTTLIAEEDVVTSTDAFPLQGALVDLLLIPCAALGGYLPGPKVEMALRQQLNNGGSFQL
eukprot:TRINITY_DN55929_c0_g1_i1.p1 TRINITY_DN55929_c0_g1~~TRINITY_DN55929_c0_g1_i1.p1  ORF type:complete len:266 (+),score=26.69 TRINITY_DN55929_c0_g1_i1:74-871(+)